MLNLMYKGESVLMTSPGTTFTLPNGDTVTPAYEGWSNAAGYSLVAVQPEPQPVPTPEELLEIERFSMELSFAQFLVALEERGWITEEEAGAWLRAEALPVAVQGIIDGLPGVDPKTGVNERLRAYARALRPSVIKRSNPLLLMMANARQVPAEEVDDIFRFYRDI
jgi:hypothetical protein